ncbi:hypothetical protein Btru_003421 [Bulinus truncatus]|nr:hypothetical protein Btru_003421 [Bulinus truncatus]
MLSSLFQIATAEVHPCLDLYNGISTSSEDIYVSWLLDRHESIICHETYLSEPACLQYLQTMPHCRRDQTKFGYFLISMVAIETAIIFFVMHIEHKQAEHLAVKKREDRELEYVRCKENGLKCSRHYRVPPVGELQDNKSSNTDPHTSLIQDTAL